MIVEPIGVVTIVVGLLCLVLGLRFAAFALMFSTLFGASAALILPAFGNANIQPAHLLLAFSVVTAFARKDVLKNLLTTARYPKPGFWLSLAVLYGIVSAYYFPRLFSGLTYVFGLRTDSNGSVVLAPLAPSSGNVTQTLYFLGDLVCFLTFSAYAAGATGKRVLGQALLFCAAANLVFAALDVATYSTNTTELLSPIRNATYRLLNDADAIGLKRLVGSFSEASAFGFATLGFFAFATELWLEGVYRRTTLAIAALSLVALTFSTSTTAYVGTSIFLLLTFAKCLSRTTVARVTPQTASFVLIMPLLVAVVATAVLLNDELNAYMHQAIDTVLLTKLSSSSGLERTAWNTQALANFRDTYWLGGGIGSLRASSLPLVVLGSIGIAGAFLYGAFVCGVLVHATPQRVEQTRLSAAMQRAARASCLAWLLAASFTSAFVDLGLQFFLLAALAAADADPDALPRAWVRGPAGVPAQ
jgi:hypothetical protein